jgi:FlaA1/EpsC-like NDP-sugar epimerase
LVLQAAALGKSGQVMVLDMGDPIKITDLVDHLLRLMGKERGSVPFKYIGLRPGEKLFEEISSEHETVEQTAHSKIKFFNQDLVSPERIVRKIDEALKISLVSSDDQVVIQLLHEIVPEYETGAKGGAVCSNSD